MTISCQDVALISWPRANNTDWGTAATGPSPCPDACAWSGPDTSPGPDASPCVCCDCSKFPVNWRMRSVRDSIYNGGSSTYNGT